MTRWFLHPISLRSRLLIGVGAMLLPLVLLAGGAILVFNNTLLNFDQAEGVTRDQAFPLSELEFSLIKLALLTAKAEPSEFVTNKAEFDALTQKISQDLKNISQGESAWTTIQGQQILLQKTNKQWESVSANLKYFFADRKSLSNIYSIHDRLDLIQDIENVIITVNSLQYRWESWQYDTNRQRAQQSSEQGLILLTLIGVLAISLAILSGWALSRTILMPLKILEEGMSRFSEGDLSHRIELQTQDELSQLATVFNQMAIRIEKTQVKLINQATLDGLTGVYNRREFNRFLHAAIQQAGQEGIPISLVMIDLDHFKSLNDTYGHQTGDLALQRVAKILKKNVRPGDIVARYGGEEFALVLPSADSQDAVVIAERIRATLAAHEIEVSGNQTLTITASLGLATFPTDATAEDILIKAADQALYTAKRTGRNQVCQAGQTAA